MGINKMRFLAIFILENVFGQDTICQAPQNICDGVKHCALGEDETNCAITVAQGSSPVNCVNLFRCDNKCMELSKVCDGVQDCTNGIDESLCFYYGNPEFWMTGAEGPCGQLKCTNPLTCDQSCKEIGFYKCYDARHNEVDKKNCADSGADYVEQECDSCKIIPGPTEATTTTESSSAEKAIFIPLL